MSELFQESKDLEELTAEELREQAEWFGEREWESNREACIEELEARNEPTDSSSEVVGEEVAELQEKLELFRRKGWEANADKVEAELSRRGELDSEEELTAAEELSEDDTVEVKMARFYSTDPFKFGDIEDISEAEREVAAEELSEEEYEAVFQGVTYRGP